MKINQIYQAFRHQGGEVTPCEVVLRKINAPNKFTVEFDGKMFPARLDSDSVLEFYL